MRGKNISMAERETIRRRLAAGESAREIATTIGRSHDSVDRVRRAFGGVPPRRSCRSGRYLSVTEREEISRGLVAGRSLTSMAARLGRPTSTVSREVARNGGRDHYRAWSAERAAADRARRPKAPKLAVRAALRAVVETWLVKRWSPQQIARRLRSDYPDQPEMWVSHETIYQSLFVQGRGALRKELTRCLRSGRTQRRPRGRTERRGRLADMVMISERPAETEDRAVPGHWEGDLLIGKANRSAIATLVERSTRYVLLGRLEHGMDAAAVRAVLATLIQTLPAHLRRTLTWDQGKEMAEHVRFSIDTGVQVFFCDPHSPWQRGTNENTNGLLRQYFPKGTDLSIRSQADLDAVAAELNDRPRQTLEWLKPSERLAELVATTG
jgi:transposase, IS30 family